MDGTDLPIQNNLVELGLICPFRIFWGLVCCTVGGGGGSSHSFTSIVYSHRLTMIFRGRPLRTFRGYSDMQSTILSGYMRGLHKFTYLPIQNIPLTSLLHGVGGGGGVSSFTALLALFIHTSR